MTDKAFNTTSPDTAQYTSYTNNASPDTQSTIAGCFRDQHLIPHIADWGCGGHAVGLPDFSLDIFLEILNENLFMAVP